MDKYGRIWALCSYFLWDFNILFSFFSILYTGMKGQMWARYWKVLPHTPIIKRAILYPQQCIQPQSLLLFKSWQISGKWSTAGQEQTCSLTDTAPLFAWKVDKNKTPNKWHDWPQSVHAACAGCCGVDSAPAKGNEKFLVEVKEFGRGPASFNNPVTNSKSKSGVQCASFVALLLLFLKSP